jgi:hypothetical protein
MKAMPATSTGQAEMATTATPASLIRTFILDSPIFVRIQHERTAARGEPGIGSRPDIPRERD